MPPVCGREAAAERRSLHAVHAEDGGEDAPDLADRLRATPLRRLPPGQEVEGEVLAGEAPGGGPGGGEGRGASGVSDDLDPDFRVS